MVLEKIASGGANYGDAKIDGKVFKMMSIGGDTMFELSLENVAQCVVPTNNRDDLEIQFQESNNKEDDCIAQITFHFPTEEDVEGDDDEPADRESLAENFKSTILNSGISNVSTDSVIVEFTKEQGNFITPRGKYSIQMTSTYMHLQGAQYFYKIKYDDIHSLFLLPKPDGGNRHSLVIALEKPIRQGSNKYQNLVIETHNMETTIALNLTEEECQNKYDGQLSTEFTMPLCNIMAKMMKVLSQSPVFVPKTFTSTRGVHGLRCALKANDGILYPLAKAFIYIHKPTIILKFEDVESIEFLRAESSLGGRQFDLKVNTKSAAVTGDTSREYTFTSIDKAEYGLLYDFLASKNLPIATEKEQSGRKSLAGLDDDDIPGDDSEEEDDDYEGGSNDSESDDDSGSSASGSGNEDSDGGDKKKRKKEKSKKSPSKKSKKVESGKKKKTKDPNQPKKPLSSFMLYSAALRATIKAENPEFSIGDIGKELGRRWKELSSEDKAPFENDAKRLKAEYVEKMKAYKQGKDGDDSNAEDIDDAAMDED